MATSAACQSWKTSHRTRRRQLRNVERRYRRTSRTLQRDPRQTLTHSHRRHTAVRGRQPEVAVAARVNPWQAAEGIPYASRGGTLFLEDPLHRQFLLGLRAIADRDEGVAVAALLRPPFFAMDLADLLNERAATKDGYQPR
jgi:hypothetical protein